MSNKTNNKTPFKTTVNNSFKEYAMMGKDASDESNASDESDTSDNEDESEDE